MKQLPILVIISLVLFTKSLYMLILRNNITVHSIFNRSLCGGRPDGIKECKHSSGTHSAGDIQSIVN